MSVLSFAQVFLGTGSLGVSVFWQGAGNPYQVVHDRVVFFRKTFLPSKLGKWVKKRPKKGFLDLKKNLVVNFHWNCSIMKIYIISCVRAQFLFNQSYCRIFKSTISQEQIDETASFLHVDTNSKKTENWSRICWLGMGQNGCGQSGLWTLKLTVPKEWNDGIKWFFACWYKFTQIKRRLKIFGVSMVKKWVWSIWWRYSKTDCVWRMNK